MSVYCNGNSGTSALLSLHMPKLVAVFDVVPCSKACREIAFVYPTCLEVKVACCRLLCLRAEGVVCNL